MSGNIDIPVTLFKNITVTGNALSTTYQNTTGLPRLVAITLNTAGATLTVQIDTFTPPTTDRLTVSSSTTGKYIAFIVSPGQYYKVESAGAGLLSWTEWD